MAVEIKLKPSPLIFCAVYMRVFELEVALKHTKIVKQLETYYSNHKILVVGDFNIDSVRWVADESNLYYLPVGARDREEEFFNAMHDLCFCQLSNITNKYGNVLDLVFVNEYTDVDLMVDKSRIIETMQQDQAHVPYEITFDYFKDD